VVGVCGCGLFVGGGGGGGGVKFPMHLFPALEQNLGGKRCKDNRKV
jgi:hypothetical protein